MADVTIAEFITARLNGDEAVARAVEDRSAPWDGQWKPDGADCLRTYNGWVLFYRRDIAPLAPGLVDHVARWDPARALAEVAAKRRLTTLHDPQHHQCVAEDGPTQWHARDPCATLRLLALPYAGHADYRAEWAPDAR